MKKTLAVLLAALMLLALVPAVAEEAEASVVYVTIANGELVAAQQPLVVGMGQVGMGFHRALPDKHLSWAVGMAAPRTAP